MNTFYCHCHYFSFRCFLVFLETVGLLLYQMTWVFITCFGESGQMEGSLIHQDGFVLARQQSRWLSDIQHWTAFVKSINQLPSKILNNEMRRWKKDHRYGTNKTVRMKCWYVAVCLLILSFYFFYSILNFFFFSLVSLSILFLFWKRDSERFNSFQLHSFFIFLSFGTLLFQIYWKILILT